MTAQDLAQLSLPARIVIADQIRLVRNAVASEVTDAFFARHPDWLARYGAAGRGRGIEDAAHHLDFIAAAVESGSVPALRDYARWCSRVLNARGIAPAFVAENLEQIGDALAAKISSPDVIATLIQTAIGASLEPLQRRSSSSSSYQSERSVFLQAIRIGRRREALAVAREALHQGIAATKIYTHIFEESLYEIGRLWEVGEISVAQEHLATATVQYVIAQIYADLPLAESKRGNAIVTGVEGEFHQLGGNMIADLLEADGWDVRFLGTNMPQRGIIAAIEEHNVTLLGISATMLFNLAAVRSLVDEVRAARGPFAPRIVVGGSAFRLCPDFCHEIGVVGPAKDLLAAVQLCAA